MSRQWAIVWFSSADAAGNANTGSLSVSGPPGVTMVLALQPAADDTQGVRRNQHHQHRQHQQQQKEESEGDEQGARHTFECLVSMNVYVSTVKLFRGKLADHDIRQVRLAVLLFDGDVGYTVGSTCVVKVKPAVEDASFLHLGAKISALA